MMTPAEIEALIRAALPDAVVLLEDLTGGQDHWSAVVVSATFEGQSPIRRHRAVYGALGDAVGGPIHALQLKTVTPRQAQLEGIVPPARGGA